MGQQHLMITDPVAGEINPDPNGPCKRYMDDGRSSVCVACDHERTAHEGETEDDI